MAEPGFLCTTQKLIVSDSDMAAAAQQLVQLSDDIEDRNSSTSTSNNGKKVSLLSDRDDHKEERSWGREISWRKKIEEIFGKEEEYEEVYRPKKRRYRSLVSIYRVTKPIFR